MMLRKVGFAEIAAAVLQNLRTNTDYACYDAVARDTPSPFLFVEVVGSGMPPARRYTRKSLRYRFMQLPRQAMPERRFTA